MRYPDIMYALDSFLRRASCPADTRPQHIAPHLLVGWIGRRGLEFLNPRRSPLFADRLVNGPCLALLSFKRHQSPPVSCLRHDVSMTYRGSGGMLNNLPRAVALDLLMAPSSSLRLSRVALRGARSRTAVLSDISIRPLWRMEQLEHAELTEGVHLGQGGGSHQGGGGSESEDDSTEGLHFV